MSEKSREWINACIYNRAKNFYDLLGFIKTAIDYFFTLPHDGLFFYNIGPLVGRMYGYHPNPVGRSVFENATTYCKDNEDQKLCPKFRSKARRCYGQFTISLPSKLSRGCNLFTCKDGAPTAYDDAYRYAEALVCVVANLDCPAVTNYIFKASACHIRDKFQQVNSSYFMSVLKTDWAPIIQDLDYLCKAKGNPNAIEMRTKWAGREDVAWFQPGC